MMKLFKNVKYIERTVENGPVKTNIDFGDISDDCYELMFNITENVIIISADDQITNACILRQIKKENLKPYILGHSVAKRGYHYYFKNTKSAIGKGSDKICNGGFKIDIMSSVSSSNERIKKSGVMREWIAGFEPTKDELDFNDLPEIPVWLRYEKESDLVEYKEIVEGERNTIFFQQFLKLLGYGVSLDDARKCLSITNAFSEKPISEHELETITKESDITKKTIKKSQNRKENKLKNSDGSDNIYDTTIDALLENGLRIAYDKDRNWYWNGNRWLFEEDGRNYVRGVISNMHKGFLQRDRSEVLDRLKIRSVNTGEVLSTKSKVVALRNCYLDFATGEKLEVNPDYFMTRVYNVDYDPDVDTKPLDDYMDGILGVGAGSDWEQVEAMYGFIGCILCDRENQFKEFVQLLDFKGTADNGKTTFCWLIKNCLKTVDGNSAYSNVKTSLLDTSKDKFILSTLYNMAVNIDDEGSKRRLSGDCSDVVKALVSSTELEYQFKNKDAKSGLFNIKLIVCGNTPLKSQLLSKDWTNKQRIFLFKRTFGPHERNLDMKELISSDSFKSMLIKRALEYYQKLMNLAKNKQTLWEKSDTMKLGLKWYMRENNPAVKWIDKANIAKENVLGRTVKSIWNKYREWCENCEEWKINRSDWLTEVVNECDVEVDYSDMNEVFVDRKVE